MTWWWIAGALWTAILVGFVAGWGLRARLTDAVRRTAPAVPIVATGWEPVVVQCRGKCLVLRSSQHV